MKSQIRTIRNIIVGSAAACAVVFAAAPPATAAAAVYTVGGTVYADTNANGAYDFGDIPLDKVAVSLYASAGDAAARSNAVRTVTSGALGLYQVTKLASGTYYAATDVPGGAVSTVTVSGLKLVGSLNVAAAPTADLSATVFEDANGNGVKDASEANLDGQTIILIDVAKTIAGIDDGSLGGIDVNSAVAGAISGRLDLGDAIHFRTSTKGGSISFPDQGPGAYVMLRSPFNLTLGDTLKNSARISALISVLTSGDPATLLDDPSLLETGDIGTAPDNEYLKKLGAVLASISTTIDTADIGRFVDGDVAANVSGASGTLRSVSDLIAAVPSMHFVVVDHRGQGWSLTGLKVAKTNDFLFGVRQPVTITGTVFNDSNANGKKDTFDLAEAVTLTVFDAEGTVLATVKTPSVIGSYKLEKLPYDTDLYVALSGTSKQPSVRYTGALPNALADQTVVGKYRLSSEATANTVTLTFGLAAAY